jgi:hypothetical protein
MKRLLFATGVFLVCASAFGQGTVAFDNRIPGVVDFRVVMSHNGQAIEDGVWAPGITWEAQLFGGPEGTALNSLLPLFPKTTFQSGAAAGYIVPVVVTVPDVPAGARASLQMRAFNNIGWQGVSKVFTATVGGGALPPANLAGLEVFQLGIPEPSSIALGIFGAAGLFVGRRRK